MVKNLLAVLISSLLLIGISLYEIHYMEREFDKLTEQVQTLIDKTEEETANIEDAKALKHSWDSVKETMHVWVPHNDLSSVDLVLNEAVGHLYEDNYRAALPKLVVVLEQFKKIPSSYSLSLENIF